MGNWDLPILEEVLDQDWTSSDPESGTRDPVSVVHGLFIDSSPSEDVVGRGRDPGRGQSSRSDGHSPV